MLTTVTNILLSKSQFLAILVPMLSYFLYTWYCILYTRYGTGNGIVDSRIGAGLYFEVRLQAGMARIIHESSATDCCYTGTLVYKAVGLPHVGTTAMRRER